MPQFAANLSMMFTERPFLERFAAAAEAGFTGVEYLFPYEYPAAEVAAALRSAGLTQALFNAPAGDWDAGERGLASLPGRDEEFERGIATVLEYARALACPRVHVMAGIADPDDADARRRYVERIRRACDAAEQRGVEVLLEPINAVDMPGYFLSRVPQARELLAEIDRPNVGLQLDLYHAQITEGDLTRLVDASVDLTRHVQIAGVPDRHEPDTGEVAYEHLFAHLDKAGYTGWVGCEYRPAGRTEDGLGWFAAHRGSQRTGERA